MSVRKSYPDRPIRLSTQQQKKIRYVCTMAESWVSLGVTTQLVSPTLLTQVQAERLKIQRLVSGIHTCVDRYMSQEQFNTVLNMANTAKQVLPRLYQHHYITFDVVTQFDEVIEAFKSDLSN